MNGSTHNSRLFLAFALFALAACSDTTATSNTDGWALGADTGAATSDAGNRTDTVTEARYLKACIVYIGGIDRMAVAGESNDGSACVGLGFMTGRASSGRYSDVDVSEAGWALSGVAAAPGECADGPGVPGPAAVEDAVTPDRVTGAIAFQKVDTDGYPSHSFETIDLTLHFDEPPSGLPAKLRFRAADLPIEGMDACNPPGNE